MWGNIIVCIIFLAIVIAMDLLKGWEMIPVSSAIPVMIFQLLVLAEREVKANTGDGIIKNLWKLIAKE